MPPVYRSQSAAYLDYKGFSGLSIGTSFALLHRVSKQEIRLLDYNRPLDETLLVSGPDDRRAFGPQYTTRSSFDPYKNRLPERRSDHLLINACSSLIGYLLASVDYTLVAR